jgi:hypothetical protein
MNSAALSSSLKLYALVGHELCNYDIARISGLSDPRAMHCEEA